MFFRKKQKVDLDAKFKEVYHEVNKITADAGNELDVTIKYSQLKLACRKYDELIDLIHHTYDKPISLVNILWSHLIHN